MARLVIDILNGPSSGCLYRP